MKKRTGLVTVLLLVMLLGVGVSGAAAQNKGLNPNGDTNFGSITLEAGYAPDPFILSINRTSKCLIANNPPPKSAASSAAISPTINPNRPAVKIHPTVTLSMFHSRMSRGIENAMAVLS